MRTAVRPEGYRWGCVMAQPEKAKQDSALPQSSPVHASETLFRAWLAHLRHLEDVAEQEADADSSPYQRMSALELLAVALEAARQGERLPELPGDENHRVNHGPHPPVQKDTGQ